MANEGDEPLLGSDLILTSLVQLQSKDHEEILNVIDQLRLEGISKYINLPQLIVCGDQSSGKSSVLEAISGLEFPVKDNLCTRFATELILRRAPRSGVTASIHADDGRPTLGKERIRQFRSSTVDLAQFATIVKEAENFIGLGAEGHIFSKDVLRVEVSGPTQPHLTLVDLPGLYHAPDESQSAEGVEFVESLVLSYLRNKRSVILAVISAKSDIALQKVTAFTRKVDPEGKRTMGIITKPDTLPQNSDMEQSFLNLALNKRVIFRLGWHVLKNREYHERHSSLDQRRDSEVKFFASRNWATLPCSQVGIESLRPRLSTVLREHVLSQLPSLIAEASQSVEDTDARLQKLGEPRDTVTDQQRYLLHSSERFSTLIGNAIDGVYFSPFFEDAIMDEGYEKRLRAVVRNCLSDFSVAVEEKGMQRKIVDDGESIDSEHAQIHYSEFVEEVRQRMRRSRGKELPGIFNPLIIGDLFYLQSRPWETMATECIGKLLEDAQKAILPFIRTVLDEKSSIGLVEHVVNPSLDKIEVSMRRKTDELLNPQKSGHPITYNHYFTEIVQKARNDHLHKSMTEKLKRFFGDNYPSREYVETRLTFRMDSLIDALGTETEARMERFACSEAISCMQAYYKVARKKFVDDFSILAVEKCLMEPLAIIFNSRVVGGLADDVVRAIAAEDESSKVERGRLTSKLKTLQSCLKQLHRLDWHNLSVIKGIDEDISEEGPDTTSSDAGNVHTENTTKAPSLASSKAEMDDNGDSSTERKIEIPEPPIEDWGFGNNLRPPKKNKKRHPSADLWE